MLRFRLFTAKQRGSQDSINASILVIRCGFIFISVESSSLLETRGRSNLQIVKYIDLPWLLKAGWSALDVAMPRTLLAVLVTETLVTYRGLGGYLAIQRGRANFAEAWGALLLLLIIIVVLRVATNPAVTRKFRS